MIKGLHHNAYRCRDSEETRVFYEDFLGLRLVSAFEIDKGNGLHTFFEMGDGSCLAFFEVPGKPFEFKRQNDLDLHIALGVENDVFDRMLAKGRAEGIEVRGPLAGGKERVIKLTPSFVIPGCREAAGPEPMFQRPVFMGSGLAAFGRAPE